MDAHKDTKVTKTYIGLLKITYLIQMRFFSKKKV